jgi:rare lipoprotein A
MNAHRLAALALLPFAAVAAAAEIAMDIIRQRKPAPVIGKASYYGEGYRGKPMANGQRFDPDALTCACWRWPLGTRLRVTWRTRSVVVTVTDRGPSLALDRVIDLSQAAFAQIAPLPLGIIEVTIQDEP